MQLSISHTTRYHFSEPIFYGMHRLRLKPKDTHGQIISDWSMELEGAETEVEYEDQNHNSTTLVSVRQGITELMVKCSGTVETSDNSGVIGEHAGHMPLWCFLRPTPLTRAGLKVRALVAGVQEDRSNPVDFLHALSAAIRDTVAFETGTTDAKTTAEQALALGTGVCQDHAHIFISAGRLLDIPMRYVGGYLMMNDRIDQEAGHAWAEAHIDGLGWVGFDVSNVISPDERYVRVSTGCDYSEAAPITGISQGPGTVDMDVRLKVEQMQAGQQQQQQSGSQSQQG